jgi:endonuclease V-like protein UPF0215 family
MNAYLVVRKEESGRVPVIAIFREKSEAERFSKSRQDTEVETDKHAASLNVYGAFEDYTPQKGESKPSNCGGD